MIVYRAILLTVLVASARAGDFLQGVEEAVIDRNAINSLLRGRLQEIIGADSADILDLKLGKRMRRSIPQYMLDLYSAQTRFSHSDREDELPIDHHQSLAQEPVDTVRSHFHTQRGDEHLYGINRIRFMFNISFEHLPASERFVGAELRLFKPKIEKAFNEETQIVQVYDIIRPATKKNPDAILRLLDTKVLEANTGKDSWVGLDVVEAVHRWRAENNFGLYVQVFRERDNTTEAVDLPYVLLKNSRGLINETSWDNQQPILLTYHASTGTEKQAMPLLRSRRAAIRHHRKKSHNRQKEQCRRHVLNIKFSDVGWSDWIVAPQGYEAYYCHGTCPFPIPEHLNGTNHAIVQTLVNSMRQKHGNGVPKACCVPTELSSVSMLYVDAYERVVLKNYQDMAVQGCGCR